MKTWGFIILVVLVALAPVFSACSSLGLGGGNSQREAYEQQLKAYQEQLNAQQKQDQAYYEARNKALQEYQEAYAQWWNQQQQQNLAQYGVVITENQTDNRTQQ